MSRWTVTSAETERPDGAVRVAHGVDLEPASALGRSWPVARTGTAAPSRARPGCTARGSRPRPAPARGCPATAQAAASPARSAQGARPITPHRLGRRPGRRPPRRRRAPLGATGRTRVSVASRAHQARPRDTVLTAMVRSRSPPSGSGIDPAEARTRRAGSPRSTTASRRTLLTPLRRCRRLPAGARTSSGTAGGAPWCTRRGAPRPVLLVDDHGVDVPVVRSRCGPRAARWPPPGRATPALGRRHVAAPAGSRWRPPTGRRSGSTGSTSRGARVSGASAGEWSSGRDCGRRAVDPVAVAPGRVDHLVGRPVEVEAVDLLGVHQGFVVGGRDRRSTSTSAAVSRTRPLKCVVRTGSS